MPTSTDREPLTVLDTGMRSLQNTILDGSFYGYNSAGNKDIAIANCFDPQREPYDYYIRTGSGCSRPYMGVCITNGCQDTLIICDSGFLGPISNTCYAEGPAFTYLWSTNQTTPYIFVTSSGYYSVTQTSADGCFVSSDTFYVQINPIPKQPTI